jgi:hypothetical protein
LESNVTSLLEVDKYNSLKSFPNEYKVYVVIYPLDNLVYLFNLNKIDFSKVEMINIPLPSETLTSGMVYNIPTDVYLLPFSKGRVHEFDCLKYYR